MASPAGRVPPASAMWLPLGGEEEDIGKNKKIKKIIPNLEFQVYGVWTLSRISIVWPLQRFGLDLSIRFGFPNPDKPNHGTHMHNQSTPIGPNFLFLFSFYPYSSIFGLSEAFIPRAF